MKTDNKRKGKAIIVGAGLGGIAAAVSLKAQGFDVHVFEKNGHVGGKLNLLQKEGFTFDLGPSILILPHLFERLFSRGGKSMSDYVQLQELKTHWRNFFVDGKVIDLCIDMKDQERQLAKLSPKAAEGFYSFLDYSRRLWKFSEEAYFDRAADRMRQIIKGYNLLEVWRRADPFSTVSQGVRRYVKDPHLQYILNFFIKYVGSSALDAPAIYNLLAYSQLGYGLFYVPGGMYNLAEGLRKYMEDLGVEIELKREVVRIEKSGEKVTGVVFKGGKSHHGDLIVSNMEVIPAYERLLGNDQPFLDKYRKKFEPSCSGLVIHLGVNREYPKLAHHNFFFAKDQARHFDMVYRQKKLPDDPTIYLVAPTRTDQSIAPKGHEIIKLLPHIPHIQDPAFTVTEYEALKERLYLKLERMGLHNLRKHIVVEEMMVPEDIQEMYYSNKGSIYGAVADKKRNYGLRAPKQSEAFHNLYFVGGSVNPGSGMPMAIYSGLMVGDMVSKGKY